MKHSSNKHHRRSVHLNGYDYSSPGAYFVTICTHQSKRLAGNIVNGEMHLNSLGQIVTEEWLRSQDVRLIENHPDFSSKRPDRTSATE